MNTLCGHEFYTKCKALTPHIHKVRNFASPSPTKKSTIYALSILIRYGQKEDSDQIHSKITGDYLGHANNEITELGVQSSLFLEPTANGFTESFQCKCPKLQQWEDHYFSIWVNSKRKSNQGLYMQRRSMCVVIYVRIHQIVS